jgi:hypothetical protein
MEKTLDAVENSKLYIDRYSCLICMLIGFAICKTRHRVVLVSRLRTRVSRGSLVLTYFL